MSAFSNLELKSFNTLTNAELDWTVSKRPLYTRTLDAFELVPNNQALVRDDTNETISIVSNRYQPIQNHQLVEFFQKFCENGQGQITHGGHFNNRDIVLYADLNLKAFAGDTDEHKFYLLARSGHYPGSALQILLSTIRVICTNQFNNINSSEKGFFYSWHNIEFTKDTQAQAFDVLSKARHFLSTFQDELRFLMAKPISDSKAKELILNQLGDPTKTFDEQSKNVHRIYNLFQNTPTGHQPKHDGTAYKLWNSVTETIDHHSKGRGRSALIGTGQAAKYDFFNALKAA